MSMVYNLCLKCSNIKFEHFQRETVEQISVPRGTRRIMGTCFALSFRIENHDWLKRKISSTREVLLKGKAKYS
jgi:hypothetical protein